MSHITQSKVSYPWSILFNICTIYLHIFHVWFSSIHKKKMIRQKSRLMSSKSIDLAVEKKEQWMSLPTEPYWWSPKVWTSLFSSTHAQLEQKSRYFGRNSTHHSFLPLPACVFVAQSKFSKIEISRVTRLKNKKWSHTSLCLRSLQKWELSKQKSE